MSDRLQSPLMAGAATTGTVARQWRQTRWNPLRHCTPQSLARDLDSFELGWVRNAALLWEAIIDRDDMVRAVVSKRCKAIAHRPWEIVMVDDAGPEAEGHKEVLEAFFNRLTVTDCLDLNVRGGFSLLVRQMMRAQLCQYAVHEIIWQPGRELRAELRHVPLALFENTEGRLRYTGPYGQATGQELDPEGWMITVGEGLMKAISLCWMGKRLSLQDWLNFSERFGLPGVHGTTSAQLGTPEWNEFVRALEEFANNWVMASSTGSEVKLVEAGKTGDAPFKPMVDRMDAAIARLVRGGDLSTISRDNATGASLQGDESSLLEKDDCELISDHLNIHLTRKVIAMVFGPAVEPLAYIKIQPTPDQDNKAEMELDKHFKELGIPMAVADVAERYGRTLPEGSEWLVGGEQPGTAPALPASPPDLANEVNPEDQAVREALVADLAPLYEAIAGVLEASDDKELEKRLRELDGKWEEITDAVLAGESMEGAIARILGDAFVKGLDLGQMVQETVAVENAFNPQQERIPKGRPGAGRWREKMQRDLVALAKTSTATGGNEANKVQLWKVDATENSRLTKAGIQDVTDFTHTVDAYAVRHTLKNHGNAKAEETRGQVAITEQDFADVPEIIANADVIESDGLTKIGSPAIRYLKHDPRSWTTVVVEEVRTGRRELAFKSMRRMKGKIPTLNNPAAS